MIFDEVKSRLKSDSNPLMLLDLIEAEFSWLRDNAPNSENPENLKMAIDFHFPIIEKILTGHLP